MDQKSEQMLHKEDTQEYNKTYNKNNAYYMSSGNFNLK